MPQNRLLSLALVLTILVFAVFLRVTHLDAKVFWHDEVFTCLWISGNEEPLDLFDGREASVEDFLHYQRISPESGFARTMQVLARNDAQHPPLFYALAWLTARGWPDSTTALRGLSALFGLLMMPAMFWLCREAFGNDRAAWLGTMLVAVSPIHVIFSQEAREYSLWALMTVLSSAALLRATRVANRGAWALFALTTFVGLYSHGLFPLVMLGHGAWVLGMAIARERRGDVGGRRLAATYLVANLGPLVLFAPWIWIICHHLEKVAHTTSWMRESSRFGSLIDLWVIGLACTFVDGIYELTLAGVTLAVLRWTTVVISVGGLVISWRYPRRKVWLLAAVLIVLPLVVLAIPDILWGGQRSAQGRYLFPCCVGITLATVHLLTPWLEAAKRPARMLGLATVFFLMTISIVSCVRIWKAHDWWNKGLRWSNQSRVIAAINASQRPLVLSANDSPGEVLALCHLLNPQVHLLVLPDSTSLPEIPEGFANVFLFDAPDDMVQELGKHVRLKRMGRGKHIRFWRVLSEYRVGKCANPPNEVRCRVDQPGEPGASATGGKYPQPQFLSSVEDKLR